MNAESVALTYKSRAQVNKITHKNKTKHTTEDSRLHVRVEFVAIVTENTRFTVCVFANGFFSLRRCSQVNGQILLFVLRLFFK